MSNTLNDSTTWHMDGHSIYMQLRKSELVIQVISCPGHETRECATGGFDCIVEWFLTRFGLDCNVGVSEVASTMEIAWSIQGDPTDPDLCQVWVIPVADEAFASWLATQTPKPGGSE
jgi:hypothetical protein